MNDQETINNIARALMETCSSVNAMSSQLHGHACQTVQNPNNNEVYQAIDRLSTAFDSMAEQNGYRLEDATIPVGADTDESFEGDDFKEFQTELHYPAAPDSDNEFATLRERVVRDANRMKAIHDEAPDFPPQCDCCFCVPVDTRPCFVVDPKDKQYRLVELCIACYAMTDDQIVKRQTEFQDYQDKYIISIVEEGKGPSYSESGPSPDDVPDEYEMKRYAAIKADTALYNRLKEEVAEERKRLCPTCNTKQTIVRQFTVNQQFDATAAYELACGHNTYDL